MATELNSITHTMHGTICVDPSTARIVEQAETRSMFIKSFLNSYLDYNKFTKETNGVDREQIISVANFIFNCPEITDALLIVARTKR